MSNLIMRQPASWAKCMPQKGAAASTVQLLAAQGYFQNMKPSSAPRTPREPKRHTGHRQSPRQLHRSGTTSRGSVRRSPRGHNSSQPPPNISTPNVDTQRRLFVNAHRRTHSRHPEEHSNSRFASNVSGEQDRETLHTGEITSEDDCAFAPPRPPPLEVGEGTGNSATPSDEIEPIQSTVQALPASNDAANPLLTNEPTKTQPPQTHTGPTRSFIENAFATKPPPAVAGSTQPSVPYPGLRQSAPPYPGPTQSLHYDTSQPQPDTQTPAPCTDPTLPPPSYTGTTQLSAEEPEKRKDLQRLYVHLKRVKVDHQKLLAAGFNVAQVGVKTVRAARLFVVISGIMERQGKKALHLLEEKGTEKRKDFKTEYNKTLELWSSSDEETVVPPISILESLSGVQQHPRERRSRDVSIDNMSDSDGDGAEENQSSANGMTLEEFARLMIIFRDHPEATDGLRISGQDLVRRQLDISATRNAFWTEKVESLFIDNGILTNQRLDGPLAHIDPGRPLSRRIGGSSLQDAFAKFKKEFTDKYNKWDLSGNMDPSSFVNFCRLPGQMTLAKCGARCLIAWTIFKFGTSQQNDLLLDFCSKEMGGATDAQLESGIGRNGESGVTTRRGKNRGSADLNLHTNMALVNALDAFSKSTDNVTPAQKRIKLELDELSVAQALSESQRSLVNNFVEAKKLMDTNSETGDTRFKNILQNYYLSLAEKLERGKF